MLFLPTLAFAVSKLEQSGCALACLFSVGTEVLRSIRGVASFVQQLKRNLLENCNRLVIKPCLLFFAFVFLFQKMLLLLLQSRVSRSFGVCKPRAKYSRCLYALTPACSHWWVQKFPASTTLAGTTTICEASVWVVSCSLTKNGNSC